MKRIALSLYLLLVGSAMAEGEAAAEEEAEEEEAVEEAVEEAADTGDGGWQPGMRGSSLEDKMAADYAIPRPRMIADAYNPNDCADAAGAVADANTALAAAETALTTLNEQMTPLAEAVAEARTAKATAVAAVITADTDLATDLASDDAAQGTLLTLKTALDNATYAESAAIQAATDANDAMIAAQDALDAGLDVQVAMDTAADAANDHHIHEQGQTAQLIIDRDNAEAAHTSVSNEESGLQDLYDAAKVTSDGTQATTDARLSAKNDHIATKNQLDADVIAATAAINAATDPSVAKTKADEESTLAGKQSDLDTTRDAWITKANAAVKAMKNWLLTEAYTEVNDGSNGCDCTSPSGNVCSGNYNGANGTDNGTGSDTDCADICSALPAWGMAANLPTGASMVSGGTGADFSATHCYGYSFSTNNTTCTLMQETPLANGVAGDDYSCKKRDKTEYATPLVTALSDGIIAAGTEYDAMIADLGEWETQQNVVLAAIGAYNMANEYKALLDTISSDQNTLASDATTSYGTALATSDANNATTATKLQNLTDKQGEIAAALATWNALIASTTSQQAEEAAQLAIKTLADGDKAAQDAAVIVLTQTRDDANTAKADADTASSDATTAKTDAQSAYDLQVPIASGTADAVAAPLSALADLRTANDDAATTLSNALGDAATQQGLIDDAIVVLEEASAARIAAIVACKEEKFDAYTATFEAAVANHEADLETIRNLVQSQIDALPARGAQGARCEKALSNGTFRPRRDETTCNEGLCCGAARIPQDMATMIIETCQPVEQTEFNWAPPRAGMATSPPASDPYPFTCISGAKQLAAAASALATAVYMLA